MDKKARDIANKIKEAYYTCFPNGELKSELKGKKDAK